MGASGFTFVLGAVLMKPCITIKRIHEGSSEPFVPLQKRNTGCRALLVSPPPLNPTLFVFSWPNVNAYLHHRHPVSGQEAAPCTGVYFLMSGKSFIRAGGRRVDGGGELVLPFCSCLHLYVYDIHMEIRHSARDLCADRFRCVLSSLYLGVGGLSESDPTILIRVWEDLYTFYRKYESGSALRFVKQFPLIVSFMLTYKCTETEISSSLQHLKLEHDPVTQVSNHYGDDKQTISYKRVILIGVGRIYSGA